MRHTRLVIRQTELHYELTCTLIPETEREQQAITHSEAGLGTEAEQELLERYVAFIRMPGYEVIEGQIMGSTYQAKVRNQLTR
ncbi:hypothetical protein [Fibrella forsythiae]|uniref:Uncharacterized protein n=1 Tax=Fibrella forsythiae TaxID=2817061 RepID=A0ABS3JSE9_9BACT|nr:hypothetical protein [Fibrella forsythiae]MBO0952930.1 hypothetical protein [Fibrella forsythiae]